MPKPKTLTLSPRLSKKDRLLKELDFLAEKNGGRVSPQAVVRFAKTHPTSLLYGCFDWSDSVAARKWRLHQARQIIRVHVEIIGQCDQLVRVFTSLPNERGAQGGYSRTAQILTDTVRRGQLLEMARKDLAVFRIKFAALFELAEVFAATDVFLSGKAKKTAVG